MGNIWKIILIISCTLAVAKANPLDQLSEADRESLLNQAEYAKEAGYKALHAKWQELQELVLNNGEEDEIGEWKYELPEMREGVVKIFVSKKMGIPLLKRYASEAAKYGAVLVFNGLPNNSFVELSHLVQEITGGGEIYADMEIDPEAFEMFNISSVPSFVVVENVDEIERLANQLALPEYDKVTGNIGLRSALELIAAGGELASIAEDYLSGVFQ